VADRHPGSTQLAAWLLLAILSSGVAASEAVASPPVFHNGTHQFTLLKPLDPAPATPVRALDGTIGDLARFRGKVVVLNFWATWCAPCVVEMPALDRLAATSDPSQLAIIAVSIDGAGAAAVVPFLAAHRLTNLAVFLDPELRLGSRNPERIAAGALPLRGLPISYVIDRRGLVAGYLIGAAKWDAPEARRFLDYFLHPPQEAR
jgi:thiol-disulfide isomerase/thioredoxin